MNPERTEDSSMQRYPTMTQLLALLHLPLGWMIIAFVRGFPIRWFDFTDGWLATDLGSSVVLVLVGVAPTLILFCLQFLLIRSIPEGQRESHLWCFYIPSLVAAVMLFLVAAPIVEAAALSLGIDGNETLHIWGGVISVPYALFLGITFVGPQQFLWRDQRTSVRVVGTLLLIIIPLTFTLRIELKQITVEAVSLGVLALALITTTMAVAGKVRSDLELDEGLRPGLLSTDSPGTTHAYEPEDGVQQVGVAISGGGYRASLFGLGALMYIHDACMATSGKQPTRIVAVSSVSGGSITNGLVAHGLKIGASGREEFTQLGRILVRHTVSTGSMFAGRNARLYFFLLLPFASFVLFFFSWTAITNATWLVLLRVLAIPAITIGVLRLWFFLSDFSPTLRIEWLDWLKESAIHFGGLAAIGGLLHFVLSNRDWRFALAWLGIALLLGLGLAFVLELRGRLVQSKFDSLLREITDSPHLASANPDTHHIFCATEVQFDETTYFAQDRIRSRDFPDAEPRNFPTALAIRASTAFPVAFPPVILRGFKKAEGLRSRFVTREKREVLPDHMILADGGLRDNLGTSWFDEYAPILDKLIVVSSSTNRHSNRQIPTIPGLSAVMALRNLVNIPYNTRERNRRRVIIGELLGRPWQNQEETARGALVHIEDSPFDLAMMLKWKAGRYLFSWPDAESWDMPEKDKKRLFTWLQEDFALDWVKSNAVTMVNDSTSINIRSNDNQNSVEIKLDGSRSATWASATVNSAGKRHVWMVKKKNNNRLDIYASRLGKSGIRPELFDLEWWDADQILAAEQLWTTAGAKAPLLLERAEAVANHLEKVEEHLPDPPPIFDMDYAQVQAALVARAGRQGASYLGSDQEVAWWTRTKKNSLVGTLLNKIQAEDAMNLVLQGYYLAMANLHITAGWPLMNDLDHRRLEELFRDVEVSPFTIQPIVEHSYGKVARLQGRRLQSIYPVLNLFSVGVKVRQAGQFERRDVILGLALDSTGRLELLGLWMAPSLLPDSNVHPLDWLKMKDSRIRDFWQDVFTDIRSRGCESIRICCREQFIEHSRSIDIYSGFDDAVQRADPRAILLPQTSSLVRDSIRAFDLFSRIGEAEEARQDLMGIFQMPTSSAAKQHLDHLKEKWSQKNTRMLEILEAWSENWDKIEPFFDFSEETRKLIQTIDSVADTARQTIENKAVNSGASSNDELALSQIYTDLPRRIRKGTRVADWRKGLKHLETDVQELSSRLD